jgi:monoamine oxidase
MNQFIIIGAGLAGLTAGFRLHQQGHAVQIYEARPRIGGRVHTVQIQNIDGEYSLGELGAQNLTDGGDCAHILALAKELKVEILEESAAFNGLFYDGLNIYPRQELIETIHFEQPDLEHNIDALSASVSNMKELLDRLNLQKYQKQFLMFLLNAYEGLPPALLSTHEHNLNTLKYMLSGGLSNVHAVTDEKPMIHRKSIKQGNAFLLDKMAEALSGLIHLNKVLMKVVRTEDQKLKLIFADGSEEICDKLILAIPAPTYRNIQFDAKLNPTQIEKIRAMPYGTNAKILLPVNYQKVKEGQWIASETMCAFYNADHKLLNLYFINDQADTLLQPQTFNTALNTLKKGYSDSIFAETKPVLAQDLNFGKYQAPVVKSWANDPYALGSYSGFDITQGDHVTDLIDYHGIKMKALFAPIADQIFFIGEHTTFLDEIGTMEAAVESGERLAQLWRA